MNRIACRLAAATLPLLLATTVAAQTAPAVDAFFATAPSEPVSGEPFDVVVGFSYASGAGPWQGPVVEVSGSTIAVYLQSACEANPVACDMITDASVAATVPGLSPGEYTLRLYRDSDDASPLLRELSLDVAAPGGAADAVRPQPGYWYDQDRPGTGFALDLKGDVVALTRYDFSEEPGTPQVWSQLAASLRRDAAVGVEYRYFGGSCLGCDDYAAPEAVPVEAGIRIRFESARRAWLEQGGREPVALVQVPFGAGYAPVALIDSADADFGPLPLPDLAGSWLFVGTAGDPEQVAVVSFGPGEPGDDGGSIDYPEINLDEGELGITLRCGSGGERAGCSMIGFGVTPMAFAALGDIEEDRMRFVPDSPGAERSFVAHRLESIEAPTGE